MRNDGGPDHEVGRRDKEVSVSRYVWSTATGLWRGPEGERGVKIEGVKEGFQFLIWAAGQGI